MLKKKNRECKSIKLKFKFDKKKALKTTRERFQIKIKSKKKMSNAYLHIIFPKYQTSFAKMSTIADGIQTRRTKISATLKLTNMILVFDLIYLFLATT